MSSVYKSRFHALNTTLQKINSIWITTCNWRVLNFCKVELQKYVPVMMAMAKIWWDKEDYVQVERIFHRSADLCSGHELWKLNLAHTLFMQVSSLFMGYA